MAKKQSRTAPLRRDNDRAEMRATIDWCIANNVPIIRPTDYQVKFRTLNFYPDTGVIYYDQGKALPQKGLETFQEIVGTLMGIKSQSSENDRSVTLNID